MTVKSFGSLLIGTGFFVAFLLFSFSEWRVDLDFIQNIRYAALYQVSGLEYDGFGKWSQPVVITLGQGLLLPFFIMGVGLLLNRELIEPEKVIKLIPFLRA